jgi:hypothetical protein
MINQGFTLHTDLFGASSPGPNFINPRCFGEDFAQWIYSQLKKRGLSVSDPIQEDFGWVLLVTYHEHIFTLAIQIMDDSIGSMPAEWRIDVSFEKPLNGFRAWFRKPPQSDLIELARIVEEVLASESRFRNLTPAA